MKYFSTLLILTITATLCIALQTHAGQITLVDQGESVAPIILADDAPATTKEAAATLARYIEKISGTRPRIVQGIPSPMPTSAIWVGMQPGLTKAMPDLSLTFEHPEEILMASDGNHLAILGRDHFIDGTQIEYGTPNAVYIFIEKYLDVRWFWPGETGEDVIERKTITLPSFTYRYHPQIRQRKMYRGQYTAALNQKANDWYRFLHLQPLDSYLYEGGHASTDWWEKYHVDHPDYFALLSNGKREPYRRPADVKLCVSNPAVAKQWLDNADEALRNDPTITTISATPNDGPGFCVCENCRAMDNPDGPKIWGYVALTDRYVKYWNTLARGLRERHPDRPIDVAVYGYSAYKTPPVSEKLEPNIAVGYVGHFPLASDEMRQKEHESFNKWSNAASSIIFRPNLFHYTGGWFGMPSVALRQTLEDFKFLANNNCVGISVDTLPQVWSTQGLQIYLMAKLTYDPMQDGQAILDDYYTRGFGPAASDVRQYYDVLQKAHDMMLGKIAHSSAKAKESVIFSGQAFNIEVMQEAAALLDAAAQKVKHTPGKYAARVAFLRAGCDFVTVQTRIITLMTQIRESEGKDTQAVAQAIALCEQREQMFKDHYADFALKYARWYHDARKLDDYLGPPSQTFRDAAGIK